jgi:hypothetical protein
MKMKKYSEFISESTKTVESGVETILKFLYDNDINNWSEFEALDFNKRQWVNKLINSSVVNKNDLDELRFKLKLELCDDIEQLEFWLKEYEDKEEYEKCHILQNKIDNI